MTDHNRTDQPTETSVLGAVLAVIGLLVLAPLGLAAADTPAVTEDCRCTLNDPRERVR